MKWILLDRYRQWTVTSVVTLIILTLTGLGVHAQGGYPEPADVYINDLAGLLNARDRANVEALLIDLKQDHGIEATVLTIDSISDYNTGDATIEAFATNLFNTWGIGDREKNNGILFLVAVGDREVRIEVGSGYENSQNANMQEVINEHILPSFRSGNFSQGIYRGTRAIVGNLTGEWPPDLTSSAASGSSNASIVNPSVQTSGIQSWFNSVIGTLQNIEPGLCLGGGIAGLGFGGFGLVRGVRRYFRYRKRRCPDCQTYMVRLDEVSDDMYLDSGQKLEELLKSIDYDVWQCPNCNTHTMHGYKKWFSSFQKCPRCGYRTVKVTSQTLSQPTYTTTGSERITKDCQHCDYHHQEIVTIPKRTRSSSSSSSSGSSSSRSSFGGGRSSGGGASGKW